MAEEKMMRLSQAARKLNVSIQTITELLTSNGHRVDNNPNAKLAFDQLEVLAKELDAPDLLGESAPVKSPEEKATSESEILYFRQEPVVQEVPKKDEAETIRFNNILAGPKVLGKIDLNPKPKTVHTPEPVQITTAHETSVKETPKLEIPIQEVKVIDENKTLAKEPEIEKAQTPDSTPQPEIKAEEPIIEVAVEKITPEPEKIAETPPTVTEPEVISYVVEKEPKKIVSDIEITKKEVSKSTNLSNDKESNIIKKVEEEVAPPKLIKAQGDKLQGLKVLGKIELPAEKKQLTREELKQKRKRKRVVVAEKVGDTTRARFENVRDKKFAPTTPAAPAPASAATTTPNPQAGAGRTDNKPSNNADRGGNKRGKGGRKDREGVSSEDVKDNIKNTMAKMQTKGADFGGKYRKEKRRSRADKQDALDQQELEESGTIKVTEYISAAELASLMDVSVNEVIATCMRMGIFASINQRLDAETIQLLCLEFNFEVEFISAEEEISSENLEIADSPEDLLPRAPIVTIMGHVDHGKTSLLDYIRTAKVQAGEAGGITQHIGAYSVTMTDGVNKGKSITFLDTPGHEAFTAMRARGAKVTDIVIIVISADDSVMPQTKEAINHAQNAGVPIVFAFNKIDKVGANPAKIREDLSKENILVESWGGKFQEQELSAKTGIGVDELLDKVLLEAELLELKANPNRIAAGTVIEAALDKGRGYVSTILIQTGTLKVGDIMLAGQYFGRVRAMVNDQGERIQEAGPSIPVQILGLPGAPQAGDKFNIMETDREAREIANKREQLNREQSIRAKKHITLDEIGRRKAIGSFKELNIIVKGDVDGSVEALSDSLLKLSTEEVQVRIIHKAVGQISESDVTLASAADAIVIGFQVRPSTNARKIAENEEIEIRLYSIIYDAINEIKAAMEGMLAPKVEEVITGNIQVREVFKISKLGTVAGCYVTDGSIKRSSKVRIIREGIVVHEGEISQLKRFKDDVAEVKNGYECGLSLKNFNDIIQDDIIEVFEIRELKRTL